MTLRRLLPDPRRPPGETQSAFLAGVAKRRQCQPTAGSVGTHRPGSSVHGLRPGPRWGPASLCCIVDHPPPRGKGVPQPQRHVLGSCSGCSQPSSLRFSRCEAPEPVRRELGCQVGCWVPSGHAVWLPPPPGGTEPAPGDVCIGSHCVRGTRALSADVTCSGREVNRHAFQRPKVLNSPASGTFLGGCLGGRFPW